MEDRQRNTDINVIYIPRKIEHKRTTIKDVIKKNFSETNNLNL